MLRAENGVFTPWSQWSACSRSCGPGVSQRKRVCAPPEDGGAPCRGLYIEERACQVEACPPPVHGGWASWSTWLSCTVTCAEGKQVRYRGCSRPAPENGGRQCAGINTEMRSCHGAPCAVDGGWSSWRTCAGSFCATKVPNACMLGRVRQCRDCNSPTPKNNGRYCAGAPILERDCWNVVACSNGTNPSRPDSVLKVQPLLPLLQT